MAHRTEITAATGALPRTIAKVLWIVLGAFIAASFCVGALFSFASWFGWLDDVRMSEGWTSFAYLISSWVWVVVVLKTWPARLSNKPDRGDRS